MWCPPEGGRRIISSRARRESAAVEIRAKPQNEKAVGA
jgi:hypothetical protein